MDSTGGAAALDSAAREAYFVTYLAPFLLVVVFAFLGQPPIRGSLSRSARGGPFFIRRGDFFGSLWTPRHPHGAAGVKVDRGQDSKVGKQKFARVRASAAAAQTSACTARTSLRFDEIRYLEYLPIGSRPTLWA